MLAKISAAKRAIWFFGLGLLVVAIDQICKQLALENLRVGVVEPVFGDLLGLTLAHNNAAAFSLGFGYTWIFAITSSIAAAYLIWWSRKIETQSWAILSGVLLGGILGNLIDRFAQAPYGGSGYVIDFFVIPFNFPIFNVADIAICTSIALGMLRYIAGVPFGKSKPNQSAAQLGDSHDE